MWRWWNTDQRNCVSINTMTSVIVKQQMTKVTKRVSRSLSKSGHHNGALGSPVEPEEPGGRTAISAVVHETSLNGGAAKGRHLSSLLFFLACWIAQEKGHFLDVLEIFWFRWGCCQGRRWRSQVWWSHAMNLLDYFYLNNRKQSRTWPSKVQGCTACVKTADSMPNGI